MPNGTFNAQFEALTGYEPFPWQIQLYEEWFAKGEFPSSREWPSDPSRPAVICGTVDMIGSRLLFSGYGVGFKGRPLHAGFLGQDVLLVHDEAHLEEPFQRLAAGIEDVQKGFEGERVAPRLHVLALTATPRGAENPLRITDADREAAKERLGAMKAVTFVAAETEADVFGTVDGADMLHAADRQICESIDTQSPGRDHGRHGC